MTALLLSRVVSGLAGVGILTGLALPMLPLQDPWQLSGALFALFVALALLTLWFCVRGHSERHRRAFLWSVISAFALGLSGFITLYIASPLLWPEEPFAIPVFSLLAGALGFVIGSLVGPAKLVSGSR